ncbi:hypothetical protein BT96DRAFT_1001302 [Gymnopus androsaceus JB14]|uniref:Uncharacterized protein n=1 Tax=Gymnopus androsaceus JB14 TaxID=1447944 RepID=A0A6A4H148_9AGAR|nr:hypothetical protein BT96DRAFT_1001302 [Gymnopus androsaceus JB14]
MDVDIGLKESHFNDEPIIATEISPQSPSPHSDDEAIMAELWPRSPSPPGLPSAQQPLRQAPHTTSSHAMDISRLRLHPVIPQLFRILLLHVLNPQELLCCDGLCGAIIPSEGIFVTSPDMSFVPMPLAFTRVLIRCLHNFGKDDPLFWPQPFDSAIGHLAVIPCPTFTNPDPSSRGLIDRFQDILLTEGFVFLC